MRRLLIIATIVAIASCASTKGYDDDLLKNQQECDAQAFPTQAEVDECYVKAEESARSDAEYRREDRKQKDYEKLVTMIRNCRAAPDLVVMYICRACSSGEMGKMRRAERKGEVYIPRDARASDFRCVNGREFMRGIFL